MDRYFFIHIQKTAGTSLRRHLQANFEQEEIYPPANQGNLENYLISYLAGGLLVALPAEIQARFRLFHGHMPYTVSQRLSLPEAPKTITLLRNPIDRALSILGQKSRHRPEFANATLDEIYDNESIFQGQILNHQAKTFAIPDDSDLLGGFAPYPVGPAELETAKENLAAVDVIGLQEDMGAFLELLTSTFGWTMLQEEVRENVGRERQVNDALRQRIAEDNGIDLEFYEYARELVNSRTARKSPTG